ncbi:MAG: MlaD family protein [Veillonellaceae bacterium]|nr:MlaD family protein [Veillonellaceae bacterium]
MSTEAKVGLFTISGLLLLFIAVLHLSGYNPARDNDYTVYVGFNKVTGLAPQAEVLYAGVHAGRVESVRPDGRGVEVTITVDPSIKIPRDAAVTIGSSGVMGDKYISILPEKSISPEYLENGDFIVGQDEQGIDTVIEQAGKTLESVQQLLASVNDIVGNPKLKDSMLKSAVNVRDITANIRDMTAAISRIVVRNEDQADAMMANLVSATASMNQAMDTISRMADDVSDDGATAANLKLAIVNLRKTSEDISASASAIRDVVTDPEKQKQIDHIISNAEDITKRGRKVMDKIGKVSDIDVKANIDVLYSGSEHDWTTNAALDLYKSPHRYITLGVDDIGGRNSTVATVGRIKRHFGARAGIIDNKPGFGVDMFGGKRFKFSADASDFDDMELRLLTVYNIADDTAIMAQWNNVNHSDDRAAYFGIRQSF